MFFLASFVYPVAPEDGTGVPLPAQLNLFCPYLTGARDLFGSGLSGIGGKCRTVNIGKQFDKMPIITYLFLPKSRAALSGNPWTVSKKSRKGFFQCVKILMNKIVLIY